MILILLLPYVYKVRAEILASNHIKKQKKHSFLKKVLFIKKKVVDLNIEKK